MLKKILVPFAFMAMLMLAFSGEALAVKQNPKATAHLGSYNILAKNWYSKYCTATQSHINIRTDNTRGTSTVYLEYRGPNQPWKSFGATGKRLRGGSGYTYNVNAKKGYDYRVRVNAGWTSVATGTVTCW